MPFGNSSFWGVITLYIRRSHTWLRAVEADLGQLNIGLVEEVCYSCRLEMHYGHGNPQRSSGVCYNEKTP